VQSYLQQGRGRRRATNRAMCAIEVDQVIVACRHVLATPRTGRSAA